MIIRNWIHTDRIKQLNGEVVVLIPAHLENYLVSIDQEIEYQVLGAISLKIRLYKKFMNFLFNAYYFKYSFSKQMIVSTMLPLRQRILIRLISGIVTWRLVELFASLLKRLVGSQSVICEGLILTSPSSTFDSEVYLTYCSQRSVVNEIFSWDNVSSRGFITSYEENFSVWNTFVKGNLISAYHTKPSQIEITGVPFYNFAQQSLSLKSCSINSTNHNSHKRKVLYTTGETSYLTYEPSLVYYIWLNIKDIAELTIRLHPLDNLEHYRWCTEYEGIKLQTPGSLIVEGEYAPTQEEYREYFKSLPQYDLILNIASTTTLDSLMCDAKVANINFMPPLEYYNGDLKIGDCYKTDHYSKILEYDIIPNIKSIDELRLLVKSISASTVKSPHILKKFKLDFFCIGSPLLKPFDAVYN